MGNEIYLAPLAAKFAAAVYFFKFLLENPLSRPIVCPTPGCNYTGPARSHSKIPSFSHGYRAFHVVGGCFLIVFSLPGFLYYAFYFRRGYAYTCPICGAEVGSGKHSKNVLNSFEGDASTLAGNMDAHAAAAEELGKVIADTVLLHVSFLSIPSWVEFTKDPVTTGSIS